MKEKTWILILLFSFLAGGLYLLLRPHGESLLEPAEPEKPTLIIWYTDENLTDYLNSAAVACLDAEGVRVEPVLKTGLEYIDEIYNASVAGEDYPDLYIIGSDSLEKAALAGVALPVEDPEHVLNSFNYPDIALNAASCQGRQIAYPFYYETAFLLYNSTYLSQMADASLRRELAGDVDEEEDESNAGAVYDPDAPLPEGYTEESWKEAVDLKTQALIPQSIEDIRKLAASHSAPAGMENFFLWDVSDIYYNYFFLGAYMNVGGESGDDPTQLSICNEDSVHCMSTYQKLHEFFSIDSSESSYEKVLEDFLAGKTLFTIVTTDALATVSRAFEQGEYQYGYGVAALPAVDSEHAARGLSTTSCVVVNAFSEHPVEANLFAEYVMYESADTLYDRTGKLPCMGGAQDEATGARDVVRQIYMESASLPKLVALSNFWLELELAYTRVWDGADPEESLKQLAEQMEQQLAEQNKDAL
ncbi:MAG: extracellular solute-binding protein [Lachnospiraceae bacterium]|nr:extracellular solute-binding protein [Lachnospiraceae bacterium]